MRMSFQLLLSVIFVSSPDIALADVTTTTHNFVPLVRWSSSSSSISHRDNNESDTQYHRRRKVTCTNLDLSNWVDARIVPDTTASSLPTVEKVTSRKMKNRNRRRSSSFFGATPSLLYSPLTTVMETATTATKPAVQEADATAATSTSSTVLRGITQPLIPESVWDELHGDEFENNHPKVLDELAKACYDLAMDKIHSRDNPWIKWTPSYPNDPSKLSMELEDGDIKVFTGKCNTNDKDKYIGSSVPLIKTISHLPMSPNEIIDLMMDSSRIKIYNKLSLGRKDISILSDENDAESSNIITKIVRNVVQLPITNKKVMSTTLLHSRPLGEEEKGPYLMISRAVHGDKYDGANNLSSEEKKMGVSYILLGINLFEPLGSGDECRMTAITHAYQPGIPTMIAQKAGVKSAIGFVKDIRALCIPA